jgi:hypothetical protein
VFRRKQSGIDLSVIAGGRREEVTDGLNAALQALTVAQASALPWMAVSQIYLQVQEGGLKKRNAEMSAAMLVGRCHYAVVLCTTNPGLSATVAEFEQPDNQVTRSLFRDVARGANAIGRDSDGQQILMLRTMPAAIDGFERYRKQPMNLARHVATYFVLALAGGMGDDPPTRDQHQAIYSVLPPISG